MFSISGLPPNQNQIPVMFHVTFMLCVTFYRCNLIFSCDIVMPCLCHWAGGGTVAWWMNTLNNHCRNSLGQKSVCDQHKTNYITVPVSVMLHTHGLDSVVVRSLCGRLGFESKLWPTSNRGPPVISKTKPNSVPYCCSYETAELWASEEPLLWMKLLLGGSCLSKRTSCQLMCHKQIHEQKAYLYGLRQFFSTSQTHIKRSTESIFTENREIYRVNTAQTIY